MNEHPNAHEYSHKDLVKYVKESINKGIEIKKMMGEKSFNNMMKVIEPEKLHEFVNRYILTRDSMDRRTKE